MENYFKEKLGHANDIPVRKIYEGKTVIVNANGNVKVARAFLDDEHVGKVLNAVAETLFGVDITTKLTTEQTQSA